MRPAAVLCSLVLVLGAASVAQARPKFLQPEFYGSLARLLLTQLEADYGLTPAQAEVLQKIYDAEAPEVETTLQNDLASGALPRTRSAATAGQPADENLNVLNSVLFEQASQGNAPAVESLLGANADPNAEANGQTPLLAALSAGNNAVVSALIARGADTNRPSGSGSTPLLTAIANGTDEVVETLLSNGADANLADSEGQTPLLAALAAGDGALVQSLLSRGADVNLAGGDGNSPFQAALAATPINATLVEDFIARGADVNRPDADGRTPLELAAGDAEVEDALERAGAIVPPEAETSG